MVVTILGANNNRIRFNDFFFLENYIFTSSYRDFIFHVFYCFMESGCGFNTAIFTFIHFSLHFLGQYKNLDVAKVEFMEVNDFSM